MTWVRFLINGFLWGKSNCVLLVPRTNGPVMGSFCVFFFVSADKQPSYQKSETSKRSCDVLVITELILGLRPANERRRYKVMPSLIGWAQT